jgi:hypothetical protein
VTRTPADVQADLGLALPSSFSAFVARALGDVLIISLERSPDAEEQSRLEQAFQSLGMCERLVVNVDSQVRPLAFRPARASGDRSIRPTRVFGGTLPQRLKWAHEDDEDFWVEHRRRLLTSSDFPGPDSVLPDAWKRGGLSCLIDGTTDSPPNLRNYLSIYRSVTLAAPLEACLEKACAGMGASPKELTELAALGRLRLLLPQPIDRYPLDWVGALAETAPGALLFTRRLSAATMVDARNRFPFLYPAVEFDDKHRALRAISELAAREPAGSPTAAWLEGLIETLGHSWRWAEVVLHREGATGMSQLGIAALASAVYNRFRGRDSTLEIQLAGRAVEWAAALGASVCPTETEGYSDEPASSLVAAFHTGSLSRAIPTVDPAIHHLVGDLLSIDDDTPVVSFAMAFGGADIDRLRNLVETMAREHVTPDDLAEAVSKFNAAVRAYEPRADRIRSLRVASLGLAAGIALGTSSGFYQQPSPAT